jgi:hypothetical protein
VGYCSEYNDMERHDTRAAQQQQRVAAPERRNESLALAAHGTAAGGHTKVVWRSLLEMSWSCLGTAGKV